MNTVLIDKLRKARQSIIEVGGFKFIMTRPTDAEALELRSAKIKDIVDRFVVGWENVKEIDIIPGGNPTPVAFDPELWAEWNSDHPEFWEPIAAEVLASYRRHRGTLEEDSKN